MLRALVPAGLELDTFAGQTWVGVVPFRMSGVRLRATPALPWVSEFPELNVRTYVVRGEKPGVWFFSLDAGNPLAVAVARRWFHLPYFRARMSLAERDGWIRYESARQDGRGKDAELRVSYRPAGEVLPLRPGTLEHWLTERYCLYAADGQGRILRGEIHHPPWPLQPAGAVFTKNSMTEAAGAGTVQGEPLLHFALRQEVVVWSPRPVED